MTKPKPPPPKPVSTEPAPGDVEPKTRPEAYFEHKSFRYWSRDAHHELKEFPEKTMQMKLEGAGFSAISFKGVRSEVDQQLRFTQEHFGVDYVGRLAGWPTGYYRKVHPKTLLITSAATPVKPDPTPNLKFIEFVECLLGDRQAYYFHCWMKLGYESRREGWDRILNGQTPNFRAAQALAIVGKASMGKTLLSELIVFALGGHGSMKGNPTQAMQGGTSFNEDLIESELHIMDDEDCSDSPAMREKMKQAIKKSVADPKTRSHAKGKKAETFETYRRTLILLNDRMSDIRILPPMVKGVRDKLMLMRALNFAVPNDSNPKTYYGELLDAIPHYLWCLEHEFVITPEGSDANEDEQEVAQQVRRFGMRTYHNASVLRDLGELDPEADLLVTLETYADELKGVHPDGIWTTAQLFHHFQESHPQLLSSIAKSPIWFGRLIMIAHEKWPDQVVCVGRSNGSKMRYQLVLEPGEDALDAEPGA